MSLGVVFQAFSDAVTASINGIFEPFFAPIIAVGVGGGTALVVGNAISPILTLVQWFGNANVQTTIELVTLLVNAIVVLFRFVGIGIRLFITTPLTWIFYQLPLLGVFTGINNLNSLSALNPTTVAPTDL